MLTIIVSDVDAHYQNAKREGAKVWEELHETSYGERQSASSTSMVTSGYLLSHAHDVVPTPGSTIASNRRP